ncbi:MAG: hypothetical protein CFE24_02805 [Flavobacterium sp. BFFFF2]|nr:MAG: hypothetical protein CFE24_02805 [Flavobacterium sp. BFFFF2]
MRNYICLSQSVFQEDAFSLVPLRDQDKFEILTMRNEQMYHLRQAKPLSVQDQEAYFKNVVAKLFEENQPTQLLFSFLKDGEFIGYGGLVHINWTDQHAEVSFIMKTELEQDFFAYYWEIYLSLLDKLAFDTLHFHKIFTYAFDVRPHLYPILASRGFKEEARLKDHCLFDGQFIDVVYHGKINNNVTFRKADEFDVMLYFIWANDPAVRQYSYQTDPINLEDHSNWFKNQLANDQCFLYVFCNHIGTPVGQVRIQKKEEYSAVIGISNDSKHRGKGYASQMIQMATRDVISENPQLAIEAFVKHDNIASQRAFEKAGYQLKQTLEIEGVLSNKYTFQK